MDGKLNLLLAAINNRSICKCNHTAIVVKHEAITGPVIALGA